MSFRALSAKLRTEMATKDDLRDLERRVTEHIDLRVDARLAANTRSTLGWSVAMNATMLGAVIAAMRLSRQATEHEQRRALMTG